MTTKQPVLIVGAGLAGLSCAVRLDRADIPYRILEKSDAVGGRMRTDSVDGFRLDRGFQVLLTAYPEAKNVLDYDALNLHAFRAGAMIRKDGRFHRLSDPFRHPSEALSTLFADVGSFADKTRILGLRRDLRRTASQVRSHRLTGQSTAGALKKDWGFSSEMVEAFFRPFIGGITLDPELKSDRAFFEFVMDMFSEGDAAFPAGGMQAIPEQLAASLNPEWIHLEAAVASMPDARTLILEDGTRMEGEPIVIATDMTSANGLDPEIDRRAWNGTTCVYFDAPSAPLDMPVLMLNGSGTGRINNVVVPSVVAPGYAPEGRHLVAVSLFDTLRSEDGDAFDGLLAELREWFGAEVDDWRYLRTYHIPQALPSQEAGTRVLDAVCARLTEHGHIVCGDHLTTSSINGALASGRVAAEIVMAKEAVA